MEVFDKLFPLQDFSISVMAILNDSTGTLMSCAWLNRQCRIGCIVGECQRHANNASSS